MSTKSDFTVS